MNNELDQFKKLTAIQLDPTAKARGRIRLLQALDSSASRSWWRSSSWSFAAGLAAGLILAIGGSVSWAAEQALPGHLLYPIKTEVNERVSGWLALTPTAKAKQNIDLVARRLAEAETLLAKNQLTPGIKTEIKDNIVAHTAAAQSAIQELSAPAITPPTATTTATRPVSSPRLPTNQPPAPRSVAPIKTERPEPPAAQRLETLLVGHRQLLEHLDRQPTPATERPVRIDRERRQQERRARD